MKRYGCDSCSGEAITSHGGAATLVDTGKEAYLYSAHAMAPSEHDLRTDEEIEKLSVTVPSLAGIPPERWLPFAYLVALVLLLALVLVMPGVRSYGAILTVTSAPLDAEVTIDGVRVGTTPLDVFVDAGKRTVRVATPLGSDEVTVDIPGRLVGSLFLPRRESLHLVPVSPDQDTPNAGADDSDREAAPVRELEQTIVADFAAWALAGQPSGGFQHPPTALSGARALAPRINEPTDLQQFRYELLAHAAPHQTRDLIGGALRAAAGPALLSPDTIAQLVYEIIQVDTHSAAGHRMVGELSAGSYGELLRDSAWYRRAQQDHSTALLGASIALDESSIPAPVTERVANSVFVRVPAGDYIVGYPVRDPDVRGEIVSFDRPYLISRSEVSRGEFARFVRAERAWAPGAPHGEASDYLRDWPDDWEQSSTTNPQAPFWQEPVVYVDWNAATAYAAWFSRVAARSGDEVRLPTPLEWEYAAFLNSLGAPTVVSEAGRANGVTEGVGGALGAFHLSGNVWEWTDEWYTRNGVTHHPPTAANVRSGDQRVVMGGAYATGEAAHNLVGAQPPEWTTPFLGFRIAIVAEGDDEGDGRDGSADGGGSASEVSDDG